MVEDNSCWRQFFCSSIHCLHSYYHTSKCQNSYFPDIFSVAEDVDLYMLFSAFLQNACYSLVSVMVSEKQMSKYEVAYPKLLILAVISAWIKSKQRDTRINKGLPNQLPKYLKINVFYYLTSFLKGVYIIFSGNTPNCAKLFKVSW